MVTQDMCYTHPVTEKRNLTLSLSERLLDEARVLAAKRRTSVNEMVRQHLERLVGDERERLAAWQGIADLVESPRARIGGRLPSRDELHER